MVATPQQPFEMAGKHGEGPPVAPPNWKWRCGQRPRDMYFTAPTGGKPCRSKTELKAKLDTLPDAPSLDDFCWKPTEEVLKTGVFIRDETPRKRGPSKKSPMAEADDSKKPKQYEAGSSASAPQTPPFSVLDNGAPLSDVQPLAIRTPGSKKVTTTSGRKKRGAAADLAEPPPTFEEVLKEGSSFLALRNAQTLTSFLEEAEQLKNMDAEQVRRLRDTLIARNLQHGNLSKYSNVVLRVFVRLLGRDGLLEEPDHSLGKVQLADMCLELAKQ